MSPLPSKKDTALLSIIVSLFCLILCIFPAGAQVITTIVGTGTRGFAGDGGTASQAQLNYPVAICFDLAGNMYIAEYGNNRVRKVAAQTGIITTVAGNGVAGFSGDGGLAINAQLNHPAWVLADNENHLYITDHDNLRVRKVDLVTGIITTIAGNGTEDYINGSVATECGLLPMALAFDNQGNLFISQHTPPLVSYKSDIISRVDKTTGVITTYAGNGQFTFAGDGGPALKASFNNPNGLAFDASNNLYVADYLNRRIRRIDAVTGIITTVAGDGSNNVYPQDDKVATLVGLGNPTDVKVDKDGNLLIVDQNDSRVRKITMSTGIVTTVAGNHFVGKGRANHIGIYRNACSGDRSAGNICITDEGNDRIRAVIPGVPASITISPSTPDVCMNNVVTFSTQTTGTGINAVYQWKKNGKDVGTNSPTYIDTFAKDDQVICVLTPGTCGNGQIFSNTYVLTGSADPVPEVSVKSSDTEICIGSTVNFTATNVNNNPKPSYEWLVNDQVVASRSAVFSGNIFKEGDQVKCKMTVPQCSGGTTKAYSEPINIKGYTSFKPAIAIKASDSSICKGNTVTFKASVTQAGSRPDYQ